MRSGRAMHHESGIWAAFDLLPDAVFCVDRRSMTVTEINRAACASLGWTADELIGMELCHIVPKEDLAALAERLEAPSADQPATAVIRTRQQTKDGRLAAVEWHVSAINEAGVAEWIIVSRQLSAGHLSDASVAAAPADGLGVLGHDPLTGLPDRRLFERRLDLALQRARQRDDYRFAVCFIDLDNFKAINDSAGHLVGDRVLCEIARRLTGCVRPSDMVARFGGDEFTVLIEDLRSGADAALVARRILDRLQEPASFDGRSVEVAVSIGVASGSRSHRRIEDLLHDADRAMYRVKARGGGDMTVFSADEPPPHSCRGGQCRSQPSDESQPGDGQDGSMRPE